MTVKWALIGAGRHPQLRIAPAFAHVPNGELMGVWSQTPQRAQELAQAHGLPRVYPTLADLWADRDVDAVLIATPNRLHAEHSLAAIAAGKHVLVEKPMATAAADAHAMHAAARAAGVVLGVAFHLRHHPAHHEARALLRSGAIGDVVYATGQYGLFSFTPPAIPNSAWKSDPAMMGDAGSLMGMGVHVIDLLVDLLGQRVVEVAALCEATGPDRPLEMLTVATLRFAGGALATLTSSARFPYSRNDVVLYGTRGRIVCAETVNMPPTGSLEVTTPTPEHGPHLGAGHSTRTVVYAPWDNFANELTAFGRAVLGEAPFHPSGAEAAHSVEVSDAIIAAARSGRTVAVESAAGAT
jgi:1,5-anhydro-D-fructose reductase (1,5-anhydro-D-mannitol-forming)